MTPEQQRIAIAEAVGINLVRYRFWYRGHDQSTRYLIYDSREKAETSRLRELKFGCGDIEEYLDTRFAPNYPGSLDAMHEAEKMLTDDQWDHYCELLGGSLRCCASSTAAQRAEAFLRTIGKWPSLETITPTP